MSEAVWSLYDNSGAFAGSFYREDNRAILVSRSGRRIEVSLSISLKEAIKILIGQEEYIV